MFRLSTYSHVAMSTIIPITSFTKIESDYFGIRIERKITVKILYVQFCNRNNTQSCIGIWPFDTSSDTINTQRTVGKARTMIGMKKQWQFHTTEIDLTPLSRWCILFSIVNCVVNYYTFGVSLLKNCCSHVYLRSL